MALAGGEHAAAAHDDGGGSARSTYTDGRTRTHSRTRTHPRACPTHLQENTDTLTHTHAPTHTRTHARARANTHTGTRRRSTRASKSSRLSTSTARVCVRAHVPCVCALQRACARCCICGCVRAHLYVFSCPHTPHARARVCLCVFVFGVARDFGETSAGAPGTIDLDEFLMLIEVRRWAATASAIAWLRRSIGLVQR